MKENLKDRIKNANKEVASEELSKEYFPTSQNKLIDIYSMVKFLNPKQSTKQYKETVDMIYTHYKKMYTTIPENYVEDGYIELLVYALYDKNGRTTGIDELYNILVLPYLIESESE